MRFYDCATNERLDVKEEDIKQAILNGYIPSVTSILDIIRYPSLEKWKIKEALSHYKEHGNMELAKAYQNTVSSEFGTVCHELVDGYAKGDGFEMEYQIPEEGHIVETITDFFGTGIGVKRKLLAIKGASWRQECNEQHLLAIQPFLFWVDRNVSKFIFTENKFADAELGYAGTADMLMLLNNGQLILGDLKVKKNSYMFPLHPRIEYKYQLSAYRKHFEKTFGEMEIGNFLLASPFGGNKIPEFGGYNQPLLAPFIYEKQDWYDGFQAAYRIWKDLHLND